MNGLVSLEDTSGNTRELTPVSEPYPTRLEASRVQAPVDVPLDDLTLSLRSLDFRPTDVLDDFLAVDFAVEVPRENEVLPQVFEATLERLGLRRAAGLGDFSNPVGDFGGRIV